MPLHVKLFIAPVLHSPPLLVPITIVHDRNTVLEKDEILFSLAFSLMIRSCLLKGRTLFFPKISTIAALTHNRSF
jgi:hypothetical protein